MTCDHVSQKKMSQKKPPKNLQTQKINRFLVNTKTVLTALLTRTTTYDSDESCHARSHAVREEEAEERKEGVTR